MFCFVFGEKRKALKHASKKLKDKANWCNKCQLEKVNNQSEGFYVCTNYGSVILLCFPLQLPIIEIYQVGEYSYKE